MKTYIPLLLLLLVSLSCNDDALDCPGEYMPYEVQYHIHDLYQITSDWTGWLYLSDSLDNIIIDKELKRTSNHLLIPSPCDESYDLTKVDISMKGVLGNPYIDITTIKDVETDQNFSIPGSIVYFNRIELVKIVNLPSDVEDVILPVYFGTASAIIDESNQTATIHTINSAVVGEALCIKIKRESENFYRAMILDYTSKIVTVDYNEFDLVCEEKILNLPRKTSWKYIIEGFVDEEETKRVTLEDESIYLPNEPYDEIKLIIPQGSDFFSYNIEIYELTLDPNPRMSIQLKTESIPESINYIPGSIELSVIDDELIVSGGENYDFIEAQWQYESIDNTEASIRRKIYFNATSNSVAILPMLSDKTLDRFPFLENITRVGSVGVEAIQLMDGSSYDDVKHEIWKSEQPYWLREKGIIIERWNLD